MRELGAERGQDESNPGDGPPGSMRRPVTILVATAAGEIAMRRVPIDLDRPLGLRVRQVETHPPEAGEFGSVLSFQPIEAGSAQRIAEHDLEVRLGRSTDERPVDRPEIVLDPTAPRRTP